MERGSEGADGCDDHASAFEASHSFRWQSLRSIKESKGFETELLAGESILRISGSLMPRRYLHRIPTSDNCRDNS